MAKKSTVTIMFILATVAVVSCGGSQEPSGLPEPTATISLPAFTVSTSEPTAPSTPLCAEVEIPSSSPSPQIPDQTGARSGPYIMAHFMPWYEAPPIASSWGQHWTMNHYRTETVGTDGTRPIASHYYPLTGPYDSMDEDVLAYQVLLMKLSGIDGAIVDWYGHTSRSDYRSSHVRTAVLFQYLQQAGLNFVICYEDQTVGHLINDGRLSTENAIARAQEDMIAIQERWLQDETYLRIDGQPVLLNFGPQYFRTNAEWNEIFSVLETQPLFFTLDSRIGSSAAGAFNWPPMHESWEGVLSMSALKMQLSNFYLRASYWEHFVASAYPGFHDIYAQAGVGQSYGFLDADEGETFATTLEQAFTHNPDIVQLVTWNDYGEGTIIEPTQEFGYQYLEMVQEARRQWVDPDFPFTADDLRIPLQILELRRSHAGDAEIGALLDSAYNLALNGDTSSAAALLQCIESLP
ncbi:MAG TPA: hypothetical protein G4O08_02135 [Anaerolineae bacterium]|nr:hypothetical protein [Anaerolineae bacterium]